MENLTPDNGPKEELEIKTSKRQISFDNLLRTLLLFVFTGIFLLSLYKIAAKLYAYHKEDMVYNEVRESLQSHNDLPELQHSAPYPAEAEEEPDTSKGQGDTGNQPLPYIVLNGNPEELNLDGIFKIYSELKAQNDDLVGWISIPGFKKPIDYPVMQYFDNEFYMTHDFYKNKSNSGSIFMDAANFNTEPDRNIILYGHAMRNNSMFGNLRGYPGDKEKYGKITAIHLDLLDMRLEYQVFSAYSTGSDFNYRRTFFSDDVDYLSFLNTIKSKSEHDFGIPLSARDKIITLSTCDKSRGDNGRIAIHAKLVKQIVYDNSGKGGGYVKTEEKGNKKIITSNVYLEKLQLQYQISSDEDGKSNGDNKAQAQSLQQTSDNQAPSVSDTPSASGILPEPGTTSARDASPAPETTPAPDTAPEPGASSSRDTGKPDISPVAEWQNAVFDPPFSTANALFSTKVPASAVLARITVKPYDSKARISVTINDENADPEKLELVEGENVIIVHVLSADGLYLRKYTINVLREPSAETPTPQPEQTPLPLEETTVELAAPDLTEAD